MLKLYDYLDEVMAIEQISQFKQYELTYTASEIMEQLGYNNPSDFESAILRTFQILRSMDLPLKQNFRQVFSYSDGIVIKDWQISSLGCFLLTLNGNPSNPCVAKAQMFLATKLNVKKTA